MANSYAASQPSPPDRSQRCLTEGTEEAGRGTLTDIVDPNGTDVTQPDLRSVLSRSVTVQSAMGASAAETLASSFSTE